MKLTETTAGEFRCPRWSELPDLPLYMDQVLLIVNDALSAVTCEEDRLTSTMVNNYVKQKVLESPQKKKYRRPQVARLMMIAVFKRVLSISQIKMLFDLLRTSCDEDQIYDLFCATLEKTILSAGLEVADLRPSSADAGERALRAALTAFVGKIYAESILEEQDTPVDSEEES